MDSAEDDFKVSDAISDLERDFPFQDLLALEYVKKYRHGYYRCREEGFQIPPGNYRSATRTLRRFRPPGCSAWWSRLPTTGCRGPQTASSWWRCRWR